MIGFKIENRFISLEFMVQVIRDLFLYLRKTDHFRHELFIVQIFLNLNQRFPLGAQMFTAAILFIDIVLNNFDHALSKQFLFAVYIRLLVIGDCSYGVS